MNFPNGLIGAILLVNLAACSMAAGTTSPPATPVLAASQVMPSSLSGRLARPILSSLQNPTQLDRGALVYWGICMACHGDRGQGLTDEWRAVYGKDMNCWASKCHAANHPPNGFTIPRDLAVPPVIGPGTLARFTTAQDLNDYIAISMPWWAPASLSTDQAWSVTAYLLQKNGKLPQGVVLGASDASAIPVHQLVNTSRNDLAAELVLVAVLFLAALAMVIQVLGKRAPRGVSIGEIPAFRAPADPPHRRPNFFVHLHPPTIPAAQARWSYTLGAGGLAVFLLLILLATGILEMFFYVPQADRATISVQTIANLVPFGGLVRNLHFWSAQALVIVAFIHMLRVVLTGAYKQPRRLNYFLGLSLLLLTLALDFTGYLLRWDQGVSWALVVGTNLIKTIPGIGTALYEFVIGGIQAGSSTLLRFYTWHVFGLILAMIAIVVWHVFHVRRDGGIAVRPPSLRKNEERISRLELVRRETLLMTFAGLGLLILSIFWPASITPPLTNTSGEVGNARAPWFLLWVQQLVHYGNPFLWGVMIPLLILAILVLLPFLTPQLADAELGRWFPKGGRTVQVIMLVITLSILALTIRAVLP